MKKWFLALMLGIFAMVGCAGQQSQMKADPVQADIKITIVQEGDAVAIKAEANGEERVIKSMEIKNPGLQ